MRAPHERNARACTAAMALKEPAMGDVDAAVATYATFAIELAKDITAAHQYYVREEYKNDSFAKGKELDKKLRDELRQARRAPEQARHRARRRGARRTRPTRRRCRRARSSRSPRSTTRARRS